MSERDPAARQNDATEVTREPTAASQVRLDACRLLVTSGAQQGEAFTVGTSTVTLGASADCDVVIVDDTVSRRHCEISHRDARFVLRDLGSTNGSFVDGTQVEQAWLRPGSLVRVGDVHLRFEPTFEALEVMPSASNSFGAIHGQSYAMRTTFALCEKVAASDSTVLICGETGTGKSALARAMHRASARKDEPFLIVDCGAISETLVESELFGHERGAFTGAIKERKGAFELAGRGTLFIDELTELSAHLQPKLLRALEDREITRVGSHAPVKVNCRVIAATQKNLWAEVEAERFRADLYFRLAVVTIPLPALRERLEDLPMLVDLFLSGLPGARVRSFEKMPPDIRQRLLSHHWPGNIRELRNTIERISLMYDDAQVSTDQLAATQTEIAAAPLAVAAAGAGEGTHGAFSVDMDRPFKDAKDALLADFERAYVTRILAAAGGNVSQAARTAGLNRKHIYNILSKHGLTPPDSGD